MVPLVPWSAPQLLAFKPVASQHSNARSTSPRFAMSLLPANFSGTWDNFPVQRDPFRNLERSGYLRKHALFSSFYLRLPGPNT
jgi:hypothetical protein